MIIAFNIVPMPGFWLKKIQRNITNKLIKKVIKQNKYGKILEIESFREQAPVRKDSNVIWDLATHDISI